MRLIDNRYIPRACASQRKRRRLSIHPGGVYVDVTFGGGGHSKEILSRIADNGHLYSFDQDADAEQNVIPNRALHLSYAPTSEYLKNWMRYYGEEGIDGLLADLGVSSHHFDDESRGFSFRFDSPLRHENEQKSGQDCCRYRKRIRGGGTGRHLLPVRRTAQRPAHSCSYRQSKKQPKDRDNDRLHTRSGAFLQARSARKKTWPNCSRPCE